ncbi:phosphate regulon sensor protein PhoR [Halalkalibacter akibai JCM 9157]|uniref:histidine kinase n=2 Tax=Halalkalibacter akibai TaxID=1411 RepID=W4QQB9_HALA3|nr:phosphate regulon sensor protein PhoR [Halalkalibacter akibai JCM 9157]
MISFLTIFILGIGLIGLQISISTTDYLTTQQRHDMLRQARNINSSIIENSEVTSELLQTIEKLGSFSSYNIWLIDTGGRIVAASTMQDEFVGEIMSDSLMEDLLNGRNSIQIMEIDEEERPMLSVAVPWTSEGIIHGGIILHSPIAGIKSTVRNIREIVLWSILGGLLIVSILVSYLSWTISKPLRKVEEAANEIALGNYSKRVNHHLPDEVGALVQSFNRMAAKLNEIEKQRDSTEQRRKDFIANISHELRTPLTAMKGFLEVLQEGFVKDPKLQQKYYNIMFRETEYLNQLVDDLMDLIKLEQKEISMHLKKVDIAEIIKVVSLQLNPTFIKRNNKLQSFTLEPLPYIIGDSLRIEQILTNIIHNANKFTSNGTITVKTKVQNDCLCVIVTDTGIGIPSHDLDRIWDRFFKVDRDRTKNGRGTGLGLAIVKELVKLHKGNIHVESKLGQGSTFTISFPIYNYDTLYNS